MHGASKTNHTLELKAKFRTRAQKKYDKMVDKRKIKSENISEEIYTVKTR